MSSGETLTALVDQVLDGKIVFFIGAGFSLDSEGNWGDRLILRLLLRFEAACEVCDLEKLREQLRHLFDLEKAGDIKVTVQCPEPDPKKRIKAKKKLKKDRAIRSKIQGHKEHGLFAKTALHQQNLDKLALKYYEINDFICAAFTEIIQTIKADWDSKIQDIQGMEKRLLAIYEEIFSPKLQPLTAISPDLKEMQATLAGKALFLDTMGFRDSDVMGGEPNLAQISSVQSSYRGKLFPRYHVLARLARESLSNMLVTTNYDLLLEGGYRMAGFVPKDYEGPCKEVLHKCFRVIGSPQGFFREGSGFETALIVKIHGCTRVYRQKFDQGKEVAEAYLPSMVFTYREIQNWREDAWSRDVLHTLLRTRTLLFSGYSAQDPVIHDTLRNIYEEMGKHITAADDTNDEVNHICYYMGGDQSPKFHALEILRAANQAVGKTDTGLRGPTNYISVNFRDKGFPELDDYYLALFHLVYRKRQLQALESELRLMVARLIGLQPESKLQQIIQQFKERIHEQEKEVLGLMDKGTDSKAGREAFRRIIGWSWYFSTGLLRQWSLCELSQRVGVANFQDQANMDPDFYYRPIAERPDWAAWAAVVEMALVNLFGPETYPVSHSIPTVSFVRPEKGREWLYLHFSHFQRKPLRPKTRGYPENRYDWRLNAQALPWPSGIGEAEDDRASQEKQLKLPYAERLIDWCLNPGSEEAETWLFQ